MELDKNPKNFSEVFKKWCNTTIGGGGYAEVYTYRVSEMVLEE